MGADALDEVAVPAGVEDGADAGERRADAGVVGDDHEVAGEGDAQADAETGALDGGDRRHLDVGDALQQRVEQLAEDRLGVLRQRLRGGQVATGGEGPPGGRHEHGTGVADAVEGTVEVGDHLLVERVEAVGPVEAELGHTAVDGAGDGHRRNPLVRGRRP